MRGVRGAVAWVVVSVLLAPAALAATGTVLFEPPSRLDRPGRGSLQARQSAPQVAELSSGPLVLWEDDRDVRLRYVGAVRRGDAWTEVDPHLESVATTLASDGSGTAWALADSPDGITTRSTRDGRAWGPGPRLFGAHASRHTVAAAGHDGRLLVARAALDEQNCGRVGFSSNMPTAAPSGTAGGLHVAEVGEGSVRSSVVTVSPSGRFTDVDAAISPSGAGWIAAATLHGIRLFRERGRGDWDEEIVPPVIPAASIQRVRIAPTESEVVVMWQLLRGKDREVVARAFRLASQTWGAPRMLGPHDGTPTLDATVAPPDQRGDESSVVAAWVSANAVAIAERNRRNWWVPPGVGGGLPESVSVATVDGAATVAYDARRVDGSTSQPYGAPNTDIFVRTREGEGHWEPGERVDGNTTLVKRPAEPRVWTSGDDAFVTFSADTDGASVLTERVGRGWSEPEPLVENGEPAELVRVAPDGGRVVRVDEAFVVQDASGRTIARVADVGRENDVVATGTGTFVVATIVGDPGRGEDQPYRVLEVGDGGDREARFSVSPTSSVDLYADGAGGAEVVTTRYDAKRETLRIEARAFREGRLGRARTLATGAPGDHVVTTDDEGKVLLAWPDDDGINVMRSDGVRRTLEVARPGYQFMLDAAGDRTALLTSDTREKQLLVARSDGGRFTRLPPLPGRFARITGLGHGYRIVDYAAPRYPACFASERPREDGSGMVGWQTGLRITGNGRITVTARHDADVLVARIDPGGDEWSYAEGGTRSKGATGDVAMDDDGDAVIAWVEAEDPISRVMASSMAGSAPTGRVLPIAIAFGAGALLAVAALVRRRRMI